LSEGAQASSNCVSDDVWRQCQTKRKKQRIFLTTLQSVNSYKKTPEEQA